MAQFTSPVIGVVSGGISCVVGAVILACTFPALRRYDAQSATTSTATGESENEVAVQS